MDQKRRGIRVTDASWIQGRDGPLTPAALSTDQAEDGPARCGGASPNRANATTRPNLSHSLDSLAPR